MAAARRATRSVWPTPWPPHAHAWLAARASRACIAASLNLESERHVYAGHMRVTIEWVFVVYMFVVYMFDRHAQQSMCSNVRVYMCTYPGSFARRRSHLRTSTACSRVNVRASHDVGRRPYMPSSPLHRPAGITGTAAGVPRCIWACLTAAAACLHAVLVSASA